MSETPDAPTPEEPANTSETSPPPAGESIVDKVAADETVQQVRKMAEANDGMLPKLALIAGGALLFISFFLPWWTFAIEMDQPEGLDDAKAYGEEMKDFGEIMRDNRDFYRDLDADEPDEGETWWGMGWDFGTGITAFIFSFFVMLAGAASLLIGKLVPAAKKFAWAPTILSALLGFVILLLDVIFILATPGENFSGDFIELDQGISLAPLLVFPVALVVIGASALIALPGLMGLLKGAKPAAE
jgi:hypothetical protein